MYIKLSEDNSIDSIITVGLANEEDGYIEVGDIADDIKKIFFAINISMGSSFLKIMLMKYSSGVFAMQKLMR